LVADELNGDTKTGIEAAMEGLHDPAAVPPGCAAAEQLALMPLSQPEGGENAPISSPSGGDGARAAGRPRGSRNKNTELWRNWILSRHESPLEGLAFTANATLAELRDELREVCGFGQGLRLSFEQGLQLLKIRQDAQQSLAPYLHGKMPLEIDAGEKGFISLNLIQGGSFAPGAAARADNGAISLGSLSGFESEENQEVIDADFSMSNGAVSNGSGKDE
jgi:hypothetical protein